MTARVTSRSHRMLTPAAQRALRKWERLWGVPGLAATVTVSFSPRLRSVLGKAMPSTGHVVLHAALRAGPTGKLLEVLCHEVAHVAIARRGARSGARRARPHGAEWATLVRAAGYEAVTHMVRQGRQMPPRRAALNVVHSCPVCQTKRIARRVVPQWRCAECVAAGLEGGLVVTRLLKRQA